MLAIDTRMYNPLHEQTSNSFVPEEKEKKWFLIGSNVGKFLKSPKTKSVKITFFDQKNIKKYTKIMS